METQLTDKAIAVSSCQAKQCHPETCCCNYGEGAILDYIQIKTGIRKGQTYWGVVK